ncbi:chromosomal replication initiator protein DnaA [Patescibacteria group bacterium]|nr:chromosomal replication initiator protein DnaA [Patescibacteria group bacterium]
MDNINSVWKIATDKIQLKVPEKSFKVWFSKLNLKEIKDGVANIECQNSFIVDYIQNNYLNTVRNALQDASGEPIDINFSIIQKLEDDDISPIFEYTKETDNTDKKQTSNLNKKYLFSNFVVGSSNRLAHAASIAVVEKPGMIYNPLFIFGGVGLGKTHLLQAIGNAIEDKNKGYSVVYLSSETFLGELIESIKNGSSDKFRKKYRDKDVLIIDDIQFISGKKGTQEEFFHTFNSLHQANKQIILASDRHPRDIENLEERLVSRFEGGMVADIGVPDIELKTAILNKKCEEKNITFDKDIINFISENFGSNVRELEGILTKIEAIQNSLQKKLGFSEIQDILGIQIKKTIKRIKPQDVINTICEKFGISIKEIRGERRTNKVVMPRQVAMYLLRVDLNLPYTDVASLLKRKDHTTVMYAVDKIEKMINDDYALKNQIYEIRSSLQ